MTSKFAVPVDRRERAGDFPEGQWLNSSAMAKDSRGRRLRRSNESAREVPDMQNIGLWKAARKLIKQWEVKLREVVSIHYLLNSFRVKKKERSIMVENARAIRLTNKRAMIE